VVEDQPKLAALLARGLREEGHAADVAGRGEDALWMAAAAPYDAIVLDIMLPGIDGLDTCRELRRLEVWTPVLMLTARDAVGDRVRGLDSGADDYLPKPFSFDELLARLRALTRRGPSERPVVLEVGKLKADPMTRVVSWEDSTVVLTPREFDLLEFMLRRPGQVVSRQQLLDVVWGEGYAGSHNVVDVYMG